LYFLILELLTKRLSRSGVPNLQFGSGKPGILPNCMFGTPDKVYRAFNINFDSKGFCGRNGFREKSKNELTDFYPESSVFNVQEKIFDLLIIP
jgi:hypothetical protein